MGLPLAPRIPAHPVPLHVDGLHAVLRKALFWLRAATFACVAVFGAVVFLAITGRAPWLLVPPFVLLPYLPIAAATRVDGAVRIIEDQLRAPPAHAPTDAPAA